MANFFFCKRPNSNSSRFCRTYRLRGNYSGLPLWRESSHKLVNKHDSVPIKLYFKGIYSAWRRRPTVAAVTKVASAFKSFFCNLKAST